MSAAPQTSNRNGLQHIGAVCRLLRDEFPDVSISKIRYLEDQGLLAPKRTQGGYRLYDEDAVERLRTILRLQRDEFLPLRVIRQELASPAASKSRRRRRAAGLTGPEEELSASRASRALRSDTAADAGARGVRARCRDAGTARRRAIRRATPRSPRSASSSRRTASGRGTCAPSVRLPTARPRCSSSSSHRRCGRATRSGARPPSTTSERWPSSARSSRSCSSGGR